MLSAFEVISVDAKGDIIQRMGLLSFFLTSGWSGNLCWSGLTEYNFFQFGCKGSGVFHASSSLRSHRRIRCRLENVTTPYEQMFQESRKAKYDKRYSRLLRTVAETISGVQETETIDILNISLAEVKGQG